MSGPFADGVDGGRWGPQTHSVSGRGNGDGGLTTAVLMGARLFSIVPWFIWLFIWLFGRLTVAAETSSESPHWRNLKSALQSCHRSNVIGD
jgi:hypothetical protein